ncbi:MAG: hypothetical protein K2J78_02095 [Muribaculaceae bacterium]|nr:hypothetical protein [Muribaculaceae bacterium]
MIGKQLLLWFIVNAILPIVFPALILAVMAWFDDGSFPIVGLLQQLIGEGFYVFSALTLVFSLYEEYGLLKRCVGLWMQTWLVFMAMATSLVFYQMRQGNPVEYMVNHQFQFYSIWLMTAIPAFVIKYKILRIK